MTWADEYEASMFCTKAEYVVNNAVNMTYKLLPTDLVLDNAADTSIIHPMLLEGVHEAERSVKIKGVGGKQTRTPK